MATRSKRILLQTNVNDKDINAETLMLYRKYEMDMSIRELSPKTIYNYKTDLFAWFSYIYNYQVNQSVVNLTDEDIVEFIYYCKTQGNNSRRIKRRISSISAFYKFLRKRKIIKDNPMEFIDRPKNDTSVVVQTFLTIEQVELMKKALELNGDLQLQTYALLSLSTMGRVNAISNVKWKQIDFEERTINDVLEKEGKVVTFFFSDEVKNLLLNLQNLRLGQNINNEYVFISKYDNKYDKVSTTTLNEWCKKIGNMIGVSTLHPHDFRHSASQICKIQGMPIETISELLNHSGLDVTKKHYLTQDKRKMKLEKDKYGI